MQSNGPVIVGVDGGASGELALRAGALRARDLRTDLVGIHVRTCWSWGMMPQAVASAIQLQEDLELEAFLQTLRAGEDAGVQWTFEAHDGQVAQLLKARAVALDARLLVVAAGVEHGRLHRCPARRLAGWDGGRVLVVDGTQASGQFETSA